MFMNNLCESKKSKINILNVKTCMLKLAVWTGLKSFKQVVKARLKRSLINRCHCHGSSEMTIIKGSNHNQTKFIELYKNICMLNWIIDPYKRTYVSSIVVDSITLYSVYGVRNFVPNSLDAIGQIPVKIYYKQHSLAKENKVLWWPKYMCIYMATAI